MLVFAISLTHDDLGGDLEGLLRSPQDLPNLRREVDDVVEPLGQAPGLLDFLPLSAPSL